MSQSFSSDTQNGKYKFVFIDLDDTLWDFHANAKEVLREMYGEQGLNRYFEDFEEYYRIYTVRNLELWEQYGKGQVTKEFLNVERFRHPLMTKGVDDVELARRTGIQFLDKLPDKNELVPFAAELLNYLSEKYLLSIVSNGFEEVQYRKLNNCGIGDFFRHIVLSEKAGALKPDRRIFDYALELNKAKPSEVIMIGDSYEADIRGAMNAGIDQIFFNLRNEVISSEKPQPTYTVSNLEEILQLL